MREILNYVILIDLFNYANYNNIIKILSFLETEFPYAIFSGRKEMLDSHMCFRAISVKDNKIGIFNRHHTLTTEEMLRFYKTEHPSKNLLIVSPEYYRDVVKLARKLDQYENFRISY